jgi:hypothetical protein
MKISIAGEFELSRLGGKYYTLKLRKKKFN